MTINDILKELVLIGKLNEESIVKIYELAEYKIEVSLVSGMLKHEDNVDFIECPANLLSLFLDGLIIKNRGKRENSPAPPQDVEYISNNDILKKVRIAFELREDDILALLKLADFRISKSEITALFRKKGHKNYQDCGDQFLRNFLRGLKLYCKNKK